MFHSREKGTVCDECGYVLCRTFTRLPSCGRCGKAPLPLLGDRIESTLTSFGITKERVASTLEAIGLPPTCGGCEKRQQWLNQLDAQLGLTDKLAAFKQAMRWK